MPDEPESPSPDEFEYDAKFVIYELLTEDLRDSVKEMDRHSDWALAITGGMITALVITGSTTIGHVLWQTKGLLIFLLLSSAFGLISRFMKLVQEGFRESASTKQFLNLVKSGRSFESQLKPGLPDRFLAALRIMREIRGEKGELTKQDLKDLMEGGQYRAFKKSVDRKRSVVNLQLFFALAGIATYCLAILLTF